MDLSRFREALESGEDFLLERLYAYAHGSEYTRYTSTREDDWRMTIREPSRALARYLESSSEPAPIHVDESFADSPDAAFGVLEAKRHRARGVAFEMFLGLAKLVRQAFVDLVYATELDSEQRKRALAITHRFFDRFELGFSTEWVRQTGEERLEELQATNRRVVNEKNRYQTMFESMALPAFVVDAQMRLVAANPTFRRTFEAEGDEVFGKKCPELVDSFLCRRCPLATAMAESSSFTNLESVIEVDGQPRTFLHSGAFLNDISGKNVGGIGILEDITDRKKAEDELREQRNFANAVIETACVIVLVLDLEGRIVLFNRYMEELSGYRLEEVLGENWFERFLPSDDQDWVRGVFNGAVADVRVVGNVNPIVLKNGDHRIIEWYDAKLTGPDDEDTGILAIGLDITERLQAEAEHRAFQEKVQQTQKLESLGILAGGIAHDFNNLLVGILGNASLALDELSPLSPARTSIEDIATTAHRAAELAKQMLAYSGKGRFAVRRLGLSEVVKEMLHLLEVSISKKAVLRCDFAAELSPIEADVTQLRQVIMNLITNASEAIGQRSGVISITTGAMSCDRDYLTSTYLDEDLPEGAYVYLEVSDTGVGMDEETASRIFEPFYTTKDTGRGLGLAAVLGIVRGHGGALKVYSEEGKGTTVKVLLPATQQPTDADQEPQPKRQRWRGGGTILLIDDDEIIRVVGRKVLERLGFEVLVASDGQKGLEAFREHAHEVVCVILDLTMPRMSGEETFRELRRIREDVRVLLTSGYNEQDAIGRFTGKGLAGFVQKPFDLPTLSEALRAVLENSRDEGDS